MISRSVRSMRDSGGGSYRRVPSTITISIGAFSSTRLPIAVFSFSSSNDRPPTNTIVGIAISCLSIARRNAPRGPLSTAPSTAPPPRCATGLPAPPCENRITGLGALAAFTHALSNAAS